MLPGKVRVAKYSVSNRRFGIETATHVAGIDYLTGSRKYRLPEIEWQATPTNLYGVGQYGVQIDQITALLSRV